jgi:hypothetical protein
MLGLEVADDVTVKRRRVSRFVFVIVVEFADDFGLGLTAS